MATGGGKVAADVGEPSGAGTDVVGPKDTDTGFLRMLRRAAGWEPEAPAPPEVRPPVEPEPPAAGRSLAVMPPGTRPALWSSRTSMAGPKSVRK